MIFGYAPPPFLILVASRSLTHIYRNLLHTNRWFRSSFVYLSLFRLSTYTIKPLTLIKTHHYSGHCASGSTHAWAIEPLHCHER